MRGRGRESQRKRERVGEKKRESRRESRIEGETDRQTDRQIDMLYESTVAHHFTPPNLSSMPIEQPTVRPANDVSDHELSEKRLKPLSFRQVRMARKHAIAL